MKPGLTSNMKYWLPAVGCSRARNCGGPSTARRRTRRAERIRKTRTSSKVSCRGWPRATTGISRTSRGRRSAPPNLNRASHDRLNRWCQDWAHQDFQIYTIPGELNLYNDFHSRAGAPEAAPFCTLNEHQERMDRKVRRMESTAGISLEELDSRLDASIAVFDADTDGEGKNTTPGVATEDGSGGQTVRVRQHLVLPREEPASSDRLDQWETNMAVKPLLPEVKPFDWPPAREIVRAQQALPPEVTEDLDLVESSEPGQCLWLNQARQIVLPDGAESLKDRICAMAHQGRHGHLPAEVSAELVSKYFWWDTLKQDVLTWIHRCLQCIKLRGGKLMPRPMGHMLTAEQPFEVIAMDCLDMPSTARKGGYKHVLLIVDQLTRVCVCVPTKDKTARTAAHILCDRWLAFFPSPAFLITDGGTHFRCELFREITVIRGFEHHIAAPHSQ